MDSSHGLGARCDFTLLPSSLHTEEDTDCDAADYEQRNYDDADDHADSEFLGCLAHSAVGSVCDGRIGRGGGKGHGGCGA